MIASLYHSGGPLPPGVVIEDSLQCMRLERGHRFFLAGSSYESTKPVLLRIEFPSKKAANQSSFPTPNSSSGTRCFTRTNKGALTRIALNSRFRATLSCAQSGRGRSGGGGISDAGCMVLLHTSTEGARIPRTL